MSPKSTQIHSNPYFGFSEDKKLESGPGEVHPGTASPSQLGRGCYSWQNARMASCSAWTLGNPRTKAALFRPPNFLVSAETLLP